LSTPLLQLLLLLVAYEQESAMAGTCMVFWEGARAAMLDAGVHTV
jgi:hypothetical protein